MLVLILRASPGFSGITAIVGFVALAILLPLSRSLSRRVFYFGVLCLTWLPLAWWVPLPLWFDRVGVCLAIVCGGLVARVLVARKPLEYFATLRPHVRLADVLPVLVGLSAFWLTSPLIFSSSNNRALSLLIKSGWDHVSHLAMVDLISTHDSVLATFGNSPDGSAWIGSTYPKHFHVLVVAVAEALRGAYGTATGPNAQDYGQAVALLLVFFLTVLTAGLIQIPAVQRSPFLALPPIAFVAAAYLVGPGSTAISTGYPNFVIACAAVAMVGCVAVTMSRVLMPLQLALIAGLVVATAHSWLLLLPLASVAALVALAPFSRVRWRSARTRACVSASVVCLAVIGIGTAVFITFHSLTGSSLAAGGSESFPAPLTFALIAACTAIGIGTAGAVRTWRGLQSVRVSLLAIVAIAAALILVALGYKQLTTAHALLYYFAKLATGTLLVLSALVVPMIVVGMARRHIPVRFGRKLVTSGLLAVAAIQLFGYVGPTFAGAVPGEADGLHYWSAARTVLSHRTPEAARLLQASSLARHASFGKTVYVAAMPGDPLPHLANQWHLSLSGTWSMSSDRLSKYLDDPDYAGGFATGEVARPVENILKNEPSIQIIVAPQVLEKLERVLPRSERDRVISWNEN